MTFRTFSGLLPLLLVPVSLAAGFVPDISPVWVFVLGAAATAVLADWVRRATEQLADRTGSAVGGLLNVSFGSVAELVLALFVLAGGHAAVVQAQVTGSIIGTGLLGLGLAMLVGGIRRDRQRFNRDSIGLLSTLLILVLIALLLPAIFDLAQRKASPGLDPALADEKLSLGTAIVLLGLYGANLAYTLVTHRDMFGGGEEDDPGHDRAAWSLGRALGVLIGGTALVAVEAELVSGALEATAGSLGLSSTFLGIVVLALVGTAADLFAAVVFARQNRMSIVFSICIGSAIQMAMVVAPLLVLASWALGHPMNLVFGDPLDLLAIGATAFVIRAISADGETTWFEGLLLIGLYVLLALAFLFLPHSP
ncbi:calcium/proton exchanger [Rhizosaccharibacter radicis]|uniref:Ca(2+)/H(+) antiporter n=1 Tax=Rhizosaccharibacter radicis TaxID=2782605 RepID=A0ABT1VUD1_9PROT|nr:calcium/proton exchanger [Acetobacteraceae bacterium KSS12]